MRVGFRLVAAVSLASLLAGAEAAAQAPVAVRATALFYGDNTEFRNAFREGGVPGPLLMQPDRMRPVQRHDGAMFAGRELQHVGTRHGPTGMRAVPHRQDVVSQATEFHRHALGQIFVHEEPRHDHAASCAAICSTISVAWSWA